MNIDITPEAVEWLAQADDAYEIGRVQSLRFAPTLRALSSENTTLRAERDSAIMANKADGKIVVDMAGAMDKITPDFMATMAPLFAGPIIEMLEKEQEAVIAERDAALAALTASQAETEALKSAVFKASDPESLYVVMDEACNGPDTDEMLDFYAAAASGAIRAAIDTPADSKAALDRMIADARMPYEEAYQYALNLADCIMAKNYHHNKDWRPVGELMGLLTQIDNMIAGAIAEAEERGCGKH